MEAVENIWKRSPSCELGSDKVSQQASEQAREQAHWQTSKVKPNGSNIARERSKQRRGSE